MVEITDGDVRGIVWPTNAVRVVRTGDAHDLVVLSGVEPHLAWGTYVACLRRVVSRLRCEAVVTLGASADAVPALPAPPGGRVDLRPCARRRVGACPVRPIRGSPGCWAC